MTCREIKTNSRFIYLNESGGGRFSGQKAEHIVEDRKEKVEVEETVDIKGLADKALDSHRDRLEDLPDQFQKILHDSVVDYFLTSVGRYDRDKEAGLGQQEFERYKSDMLAKLKEIVDQYAPTEAEQKKIEETKKHMEAAEAKAENIKPIDLQSIPDTPGEISDVQTIALRFNEYDNFNINLQRESNAAMAMISDFQKTYAAFQESRNGLRAYKNFTAYFFPGKDEEQMKLAEMHAKMQTKIDGMMKQVQEAKDRLGKYGEVLRNASNRLKQEKIVERDQKLKEIEDKSQEGAKSKAKKEKQYARLQDQQEKLSGERDKLVEYKGGLLKAEEMAQTALETSEEKQKRLTHYNDVLEMSFLRIDEALNNPAIPDNQKDQLEEAKTRIVVQLNEGSIGLKAAEQNLSAANRKRTELNDEERLIAERTLGVQTHLEEQVNPCLLQLGKSIAVLEDAKLQYATTKEQVVAHYENAFDIYDSIDKNIDDAVLKNNLANFRLLEQVADQKKSIDVVDVEAPSGVIGAFQSTIGIPLSMIGAGIGKTGQWIMDQGKDLSQELERSRAEMGTFKYVAARIGAEIVNAPIGVAGGLIEMGGGIVSLVAHPIDTGKGLAALIGRDPITKEWKLSTAGNSWKGMGKAIISYDEFKEGHIGLGIGKIFPNVVLAITTGGAATAGKEAAQVAFIAAREAGVSMTQSLAKAGVAFAKGAGGELAGTVRTAKQFVTSIKEAGDFAVHTAKEGVKGVLSGRGEKVSIVDELEKTAEQYERFRVHLNRLRSENPGLSTEDLRRKMVSGTVEERRLFNDAVKHERNLQRLDEERLALRRSAAESVKDPQLREKIIRAVAKKEDAEMNMMNCEKQFRKFQKLLDAKDQSALDAMEKFQALTSLGNPRKVKHWIRENCPRHFRDAFDYLNSKTDYADSLKEISLIQRLDKIHDGVVGLSKAETETILRLYPENFELGIKLFQEIKGKADILESQGLKDCANDLRNLNAKFSMVDGSPLGTLEERLAYYEKLQSSSPLELEWYRTRPPVAADAEGSFSALKKFTADFISERVIPALVKQDLSPEDIVRQVHVWQTRGSKAQLDVLSSVDEGYNIAGRYRHVPVQVGNYVCPFPEVVPDLMKLFSEQIRAFSDQINGLRASMPPEAYQQAVVQYATHVLQRFVEIHPMRDGNGRTARMLYEYIVVKHLGHESKYRRIPTGFHGDGEPTLHARLMDYNGKLTTRDYPGWGSSLDGKKLDETLRVETLKDVLDDSLMKEFAQTVTSIIDSL